MEKVALTEAQEQQAQKALRARLEKMREPVTSFLPSGITFDAVLWGALTTALGNPDLYLCTSRSILMALVQAVHTGLTLGRTVFLVPFKKECTMIVHYRGYVELALATGAVRSVFANVVRDGEQFEVYGGTEPKIVHRIGWQKDRAPIAGAYAVAVMHGGSVVTEVMPVGEIEQIRRQFSKKWSKGALPAWWARKAPIRAIMKYLPQSPGLFYAQRYDESGADLVAPGDVTDAMMAEHAASAAAPHGISDDPATVAAPVGRIRTAASRLVLPAGSHIAPLESPSRHRTAALTGPVLGIEKPSARGVAARPLGRYEPVVPMPSAAYATAHETTHVSAVAAPDAAAEREERLRAILDDDTDDGLPF